MYFGPVFGFYHGVDKFPGTSPFEVTFECGIFIYLFVYTKKKIYFDTVHIQQLTRVKITYTYHENTEYADQIFKQHVFQCIDTAQ